VATRFFARFLFTTAAATFIASQARPVHRLTTGHCHTWPEIGCDTLHVAKHLHKLPAKSPLPIAHGAIFDFRFFPLILAIFQCPPLGLRLFFILSPLFFVSFCSTSIPAPISGWACCLCVYRLIAFWLNDFDSPRRAGQERG